MHALETYDYAVIRVVPRVERGEFVNAGILLSRQRPAFLEARIHLDAARVLALDPAADIETIARHLSAFPAICSGAPGSGPIGQLPLRARFHWLTATRSSIIQTSPVHMGRCGDLAATLEHLMDRMVRPPKATVPR